MCEPNRNRFRPACEPLEDRHLLSGWGLDPSFGTGGKVVRSIYAGVNAGVDRVHDVATDPQGRIVLVGEGAESDGDVDFALVRVNPDGTPDNTFDGNGIATEAIRLNGGTRAVARAIDFQSVNGQLKIIVAGEAENGTAGDVDFAVLRLNEDGTLDTTFGSQGRRIISFNLGTTAVTRVDRAHAVLVQPDGRIVVAGEAARTAGDVDFAIVRLTRDGAIDGSFGDGDGKVVVPFNLGAADFRTDRARAVALQGDDLLVAGEAQRSGTDIDFAVTRLRSDGRLDTTFGPSGNARGISAFGFTKTAPNVSGVDRAYAVAVLPDGRFYLAGEAEVGSSQDFAVAMLTQNAEFMVSRFSGDGRATVAFDRGGTQDDVCYDLEVQPDGTLLLAGESARAVGSDFALARLLPTGDRDALFGTDGRLTVEFDRGNGDVDVARGAAVQPDGGIVVAGNVSDVNGGVNFALTRVMPPPVADVSPLLAMDPFATLALVDAAPQAARNVTPLVTIERQRRSRRGSVWVIRVRNTSGSDIRGDLFLVVDGLKPALRVRLKGASGRTSVETPLNSPFRIIELVGGLLRAGENVELTLNFSNPSGARVRFGTRVLGGSPDLF